MAIARQSLAFSSDMEDQYISRSQIACAEFQQAIGEAKVDLNKVHKEGNEESKEDDED